MYCFCSLDVIFVSYDLTTICVICLTCDTVWNGFKLTFYDYCCSLYSLSLVTNECNVCSVCS